MLFKKEAYREGFTGWVIDVCGHPATVVKFRIKMDLY